jgi:hypothetical protein
MGCTIWSVSLSSACRNDAATNFNTGSEKMSIAKINEASLARYGVEISEVNPTTALWVADHILKTSGKNVWKRISNLRNKIGRGTDFPAFGTPLFDTM